MKRYALLSLVSGLGFLPFNLSWAQAPALQEGFSMAEVSKLFGPPLERTERETKREEEWRYARTTVKFHEGKVQDWNPRVQEPTEPTDPEALAAKGKEGDADSELAGILGVILEEGGETTEDSKSPNMPPMPGVPGGVPGVTVLDTPK